MDRKSSEVPVRTGSVNADLIESFKSKPSYVTDKVISYDETTYEYRMGRGDVLSIARWNWFITKLLPITRSLEDISQVESRGNIFK
jgi:protein involved in polysaccharide export with SLBB domain